MALGLVNRYLQAVDNNMPDARTKSIDQLRLWAIICINLAAKYTERISFKISELAFKNGINLDFLGFYPEYTTQSEALQLQEFMVIRVLEFRIGGDQTPIDFLRGYLKISVPDEKQIEDLRISKIYLSSLKLSYFLMKDSNASKVFNLEEISVASLFTAIKMVENQT